MAVAPATRGSVKFDSEFIKNSRGMELFTCRWLPTDQEPKALVFLCHGYGVECSVFMKGTGNRLAQAGYAVFGIDLEGHGRSEGQRCYIQKFSTIVDDCVDYFKRIRELPEYRSKGRFLYGESMGGAVALLIHRREPRDWNGAVLVAPMCKISEKLKPNPIIVNLLTKLSPMIKTWKIVPSQSILDTGFKDPVKREEIRSNPYFYKDKPRVMTALQMLRASIDLEQRLDEVTLPVLVLHGGADVVTDPECSREFMAKSRSTDKTLQIYKDMWHGLTVAETDENIEKVFADILDWLNQRSSAGSTTITAGGATLHYSDLEKMMVQDNAKELESSLKGTHEAT